MKRKIIRILGVGLALMMAVSLMAFAAPVAAAEYPENEWMAWGLPSVDENTDVGPMAIAPDGTIFAAVYNYWDDNVWKVMKSDDDGYTWDDTELDDIGDAVAQIVVSPNYEDDETFYVGVYDGTVYRCEDAGDSSPVAIKPIVDSDAVTATYLYSIDVWYDGDDNWIMVGTDLDVLVIRDAFGGDWSDQELDEPGYEVSFAPDFDDFEFIWAITDNGTDFVISSTVAPGQWGQVIGDVTLTGVAANPWVDLDFPDDYSSDVDNEVPTLFAAISSADAGEGGVYMIEGLEAPDDSVATQLMEDENIVSLAVSGDASDAFILAGSLNTPTVYFSDDGGSSWDNIDKDPTGWYDFNAPLVSGYGPALVGPDEFTWMEVLMEADVVWGDQVFDPDNGVAFAGTFGWESAVSRSDNGGMAFNQVGIIDTVIWDIDWLGFNPDNPATFLMSTYNGGVTGFDTDSLWLTENGDVEEPDYMRILCGYPGSPPGNFDGWFWMADWSEDGDAIYITGQDEDGDSAVWKSTDDGVTFGSQRKVKDGAWIEDWVITDSKTIYAATDLDGFYKTVNSGLSWTSVDVGSSCADIVLSPAFEDDETILLGSDDGEVFMSADSGDSFDDTGLQLEDDEVFVAFDADYANEDADGYTLIYAGGEDDNIQVGEVADTDDVDWNDLEDDTNEDAEYASCEGLAVTEDNALYAIDNDNASLPADNDPGVDRLLLHESDSIWEFAGDDDLEEPEHLWVTPGSNVLWTIDWPNELWVLEDTCSGQVTLDNPPDGYRSDVEDNIQISWNEMRGADEYEYDGSETTGLGMDFNDQTDELDATVAVSGSSEYDWSVRVAPGEPWSSRWSDSWTFFTALGAPPFAPELYSPDDGDTDVPLRPAFVWQTAKTADSYHFQLDTSPTFATLVDVTVSSEAYQIEIDLDYSTTYYWRVQALKGNVAISRWSEISAFTTMAQPTTPPPPVTVAPPPATQPPIIVPVAQPIPTWMMITIIAIGAILIVALIVLIARTRRAV